MPSEGIRSPAGKPSSGGGSSGLTASAPAGSIGAAAGGSDAAAEGDGKAPNPAASPAGNDFSVNLSGGVALNPTGSSSSGGSGGIGNLLGEMLGSTQSAATGVNPNSLYRAATAGLTGGEAAGSMAGVNGDGSSLFEVVKLKYNKMIEGGRVQGPGEVEVKN
jgi:hypothetical protein